MELSDKLHALGILTLEWKAVVPITMEADGPPTDGHYL
jgi:hypothetical protein